MTWTIYKHTNTINGKVYIGQTRRPLTRNRKLSDEQVATIVSSTTPANDLAISFGVSPHAIRWWRRQELEKD